MAPNRNYPDHRRTYLLLYRDPHEQPSPRSGLTVDRIVCAGIEVADAEGLAALSMRRIAQHLGVGAMSLYTYVPGKEELLFLMVDAVCAELAPLDDPDAGWRAHLEHIARDSWALFERHPWAIEAPVTRPVVGPHAFDHWEYALSAVDGLGLTEQEMDSTVQVIVGHVRGVARYLLEAQRDAERSGISDDEWWLNIAEPVLSMVLASRPYPVSERVGEAVGAPHSDVHFLFEFGLERILDGLDALVASRAGEP